MTAFDRAAELHRLSDVVASYGDEVGPFDAAMRGYMMRALGPWFRPGPCLQVGCAHGDQTSHLLARFDDVTVLEPVPAFIEATRARLGDRVKFEEGLIEDFAPATRFETILFSHVLEHVDDAVDCLRRLGGLLTATGRLFVVVPNAEAPSRRLAVKMGLIDHLEALTAADIAAGHRRCYRLDTLLRDVGRSGLSIEASGGVFFKPLANFQFDGLIGGPFISQAYLDACYELGLERPADCASIYAVAQRRIGA